MGGRFIDHGELVEFGGYKFPTTALNVLLAQSAAAEVRRRYENPNEDIFKTIKISSSFQQEFLESYIAANTLFYNDIKQYVPEGSRRILDIGCGIGLIPLLLYVESRHNKPSLFLFDKSVDIQDFSKSDIASTGFNKKYEFTASLEVTRQFLKINGVRENDINPCEVGKWSVSNASPLDLVISRRSWGFHYPIEEYLDEVAISMRPGAVVITDLRHGRAGEQTFRNRFQKVSIIRQGAKSNLVMGTL